MTTTNMPKVADTEVATSDLCQILGVSRDTVARLAAEGVISRRSRGRWRLGATVAAYVNHLIERAAGRESDAARAKGLDLVSERARLAKANANIRELEAQRLSARLIDRDEAYREFFARARIERDAWLNWPSRISAVMAAELGLHPVKLEVTLERYVRDHLIERSNAIGQMHPDSLAAN